MRKFKFIGDQNHLNWEVTNPIKNEPYTISHLRTMSGQNSLEEENLEEWIRMGIWQEVFEHESKPIDNVTVELLDVALRICNIPIHKNLLDDLIDVIELLEYKGYNATIKDFEELKATWKA